MLLKLSEYTGEKTLHFFHNKSRFIQFVFTILFKIFSPACYNTAMKTVLVKQIYFTSVQILPIFIFLGMLIGTLIIGILVSQAAEYNLLSEIGDILVYFIFNEFSPVITALLVSLRSGAAVNVEIAIMTVNKEIDALKAFNIDILNYLALPRVLNGIISLVALALLLAAIMVFGGYLFLLFYLQMDFDTYSKIITTALSIDNLLMLIFKSAIFGFFIMLIPIYHGLKTIRTYSAVPISVLQGMVSLFIALFLIELTMVITWLI